MSENEKKQLLDDYTNLEMFCRTLESMAEIYGLKTGTMEMLTKDYLIRSAALIRDMDQTICQYKAEASTHKGAIYLTGPNIAEQLKKIDNSRKTQGLPPL